MCKNFFYFSFQRDKSLVAAVQLKTRYSTKNARLIPMENKWKKCVSAPTFYATKLAGHQLILISYLSLVQQCSVFYSIAAIILLASHPHPMVQGLLLLVVLLLLG